MRMIQGKYSKLSKDAAISNRLDWEWSGFTILNQFFSLRKVIFPNDE